MLDDLRNSAGSDFMEEGPQDEVIYDNYPRSSRGPLLGMTAPQRFVIAFFVFLMIAILGVFLLIVFQKVYPPI